MDSKLVSGSLSVDEESGRSVHSPFLTYTEQFYEAFPYYLSIGMTYEQFWDDDVNLVRCYRQADEMRIERKNQEMWLQGLYVYEALCDVAPIMQAMAKKGTKARPYPERPYPVTERQKRQDERDKELKLANKGRLFMEQMMKVTNNKFKGTE